MNSLFKKSILACAVTMTSSAFVMAGDIEEVAVTGKSTSYANNAVSEEMVNTQSAMTSVMAVIDNLPGVIVSEGDNFGADDWSTQIVIRGFSVDLDQQQIGTTIDGIANGNSNYGGGAKANRYIDTENMATAMVSQGTADIASRSNEALGGTINFTTIDPSQEQKVVVSVTSADYGGHKNYVRLETGEIFENTYAWISASSRESSDWMQNYAQNRGDHMAAKLVRETSGDKLTAYISYDDIHEDNYQRIYGLEQFAMNPEWDMLTDTWTGIPHVDQVNRRAWSTLRENLFAYIDYDFNIGDVELSANLYYHDNSGRGDWIPPYLVDVIDDGAGAHSELMPGVTHLGTPETANRIYFVNADGTSATPIAGCETAIRFPWFYNPGAQYDPACYDAGVTPVMSYRTTNYWKERLGFNGDFTWSTELSNGADNTLRGGLWIEDYNRKETRSWQKVVDALSGYEFNHVPYWIQYDREYPVKTTMLYLEDSLEMGNVTARLGVKKFAVELQRKDNFANTNLTVQSDSDALVNAGVVVRLSDDLEMFAGYADNFAAIKDTVLERDASALDNIKPETAKNIDVGLRYTGERLNVNATYYKINFSDRLTFIAPGSEASGQINYTIGTDGSYVNTGGVDSKGFELSATAMLNEQWAVYASYTSNDSVYASNTFVGDVDIKGNTVVGSAGDMAVLSLDWSNEKYSAGLSSKWIDKRAFNFANSAMAPAYTVTDAYAVVHVGDMGPVKEINARFSVNNLFSQHYLGTIVNNAGWLGAPRTVAMNITASF
ncbi:MAG: hypothetical protein RL336_9 [Pseudomonadota bacterium]|jgi:outer membrane receptor for Fe3+-dicitrate